MKKYYVLALLLVGALALVWCNKQEPIEVLEPVVLLEEKPVEEIKEAKWIEVCAFFTENFVENYEYEDSKWYMFALNIDWNYYNVFRNELWWVSNSMKHWLTGAIPAYKFKDLFCWQIPFWQINVARKNGEYWYTYIQFTWTNHIYKISPVKEWVETHTIWWEEYY